MSKKSLEEDPIGFFETMVEYYTGRDASLLSVRALGLKLGHIRKIRQMEAEEQKKQFGG